MRTFILTLLTTLFVSAMPLQAAYALADDANEQTNKQTQQACTTKDVFTPEQRQQVIAQAGEVIELEGVRAQAFQARVEDVGGEKVPFSADYILFVKASSESEGYNIGFFENNCLKAFLQLPTADVYQLLGPKAPLGERVD